jgi:hypothetical protein
MSRFNPAHRFSVVMALPVLLLSGCMSFNPRSLRTMEAALLESNPDLAIESSMKFGIGALTLDFIDFAFVHDPGIDLSRISRADIGIYELQSTLVFKEFTMPQYVTSDRNCPRQDVIVRVWEDDEYMQVVACIRNDKVTGLAVFVLEPREIVVINARGDFEALIASLVKSSVNKKARGSDTQASTHDRQSPVVVSRRTDGMLPPT